MGIHHQAWLTLQMLKSVLLCSILPYNN
jgi:hypothetical protein